MLQLGKLELNSIRKSTIKSLRCIHDNGSVKITAISVPQITSTLPPRLNLIFYLIKKTKEKKKTNYIYSQGTGGIKMINVNKGIGLR